MRNTKIAMEQNRLYMQRELLENSRLVARQRRIRDNLAELIEGDLVSREPPRRAQQPE